MSAASKHLTPVTLELGGKRYFRHSNRAVFQSFNAITCFKLSATLKASFSSSLTFAFYSPFEEQKLDALSLLVWFLWLICD